jgi:hypothetical protein
MKHLIVLGTEAVGNLIGDHSVAAITTLSLVRYAFGENSICNIFQNGHLAIYLPSNEENEKRRRSRCEEPVAVRYFVLPECVRPNLIVAVARV